MNSTKMEQFDNQHFDEAHHVDISNEDLDETNESHASVDVSNENVETEKRMMGDSAENSDESESTSDSDEETEQSNIPLYNPDEYRNLNVSSKIRDLFEYINRYHPQDIELETKLCPFVPEYIPAVGSIDAFVKIPPPNETPNQAKLGLHLLDEPACEQSDPTVLEIQLRMFYKNTEIIHMPTTVRGIENANKNPNKITTWLRKIEEVHRNKPPSTVNHSNDVKFNQKLIEMWPSDFEEFLENSALPSPEIDMTVKEYADMVCAILDIPIYDKTTEALHLLFTVLHDYRNNAHFGKNME